MYCISLVYPIQYSATIILNTKEELQIFFFTTERNQGVCVTFSNEKLQTAELAKTMK